MGKIIFEVVIFIAVILLLFFIFRKTSIPALPQNDETIQEQEIDYTDDSLPTPLPGEDKG